MYSAPIISDTTTIPKPKNDICHIILFIIVLLVIILRFPHKYTMNNPIETAIRYFFDLSPFRINLKYITAMNTADSISSIIGVNSFIDSSIFS